MGQWRGRVAMAQWRRRGLGARSGVGMVGVGDGLPVVAGVKPALHRKGVCKLELRVQGDEVQCVEIALRAGEYVLRIECKGLRGRRALAVELVVGMRVA